MAIFRGVGGSGESSDNTFLQEVTAQAQAAEASATAAQASANSILNLTVATGAAGTEVIYNASTGVLTVPRGDKGETDITAANVTGVLTGGTGISIASNGTITNDSPDQTVALTGTGATTVTGTYPNFTINSVNTTYTVGDGGLTTNDFTNADHTKLDGIEANATADQTGAEIKTAYEAEANTNAFTDAEKTKLSGIEASATADQTDAEIKTAYENNANTNAFTDADHTKLDGIEASADVTDTANVTAAGALMDSEVTNLAQVKAFDSSDYATAAQGTKADTAHGWGNHATVGYLTSETSHADVVVDGDFASEGLMRRGASAGSYSIVTDNSANWNTAYGWGDHSTQNYATTTGDTFTGDLKLNDSVNLKIGTDDDFTIAHDGTDATIQNDTGDLIVDINDSAGAFKLQDEGTDVLTVTQSVINFFVGQTNPVLTLGPSTVLLRNNLTCIGNQTIDGRDVSVDGAKLDTIQERTIRTRFQRRGYSNTVGFLTLTNTLQNVGSVFRLNADVTTAVEHILDLNISANFLDINSTNDGEFIVAVTAPTSSTETTVNLGTVISTISTGSTYQFVLSGDLTKHFSPYCGMSVNSDGSSAFGFNNNDGWFYDPTTDRTTVDCYAYQANKPTTGDTVYLHPFDWETSGTVLNGDTYPIEAYNASGTTNQNQFHQIYLGYYKDDKSFQIKAREVTTSENIQLSRISGTYSNIIGI